MTIVIVVYPNTYDEGRAWASPWDSRDDLLENPQHIREHYGFDVNDLVDGPVIEGIQVLHVRGFAPAHEEYAAALRYGFQSQREHEWAVQLDASWGFEMYVAGELEDESGQYDRQRFSHRDRWRAIAKAVNAYLTERAAVGDFVGIEITTPSGKTGIAHVSPDIDPKTVEALGRLIDAAHQAIENGEIGEGDNDDHAV